jgi:hypothetical protein
MRMHEIVILGLITLVLAWRFLRAPGWSAHRMDRELGRLVDRTTIELVQAHLADHPLPVRVSTGHDLRGSLVRLDGEDLCVRLRLYDRPPALLRGAGAGARLASVRWSGGRGWVVRIEGLPATRTLLGWHLEVHPYRPRPTAPAATVRWWD